MSPSHRFCCPLCDWVTSGEAPRDVQVVDAFLDHSHEAHDLEAPDALVLFQRATDSRPSRRLALFGRS